MIKVIVFDYDDTLVKSSEALYSADSKTAISLGLANPTREEYFALWGKPHIEMIKVLHPSISQSQYLGQYKKIYDPSHLELFSEVKPLLKKIAMKKIKIAVLSSKEKSFLEEHLRYAEISDYVEHIHSSESSKYKKPDPRVFEDIIKHFKTEPSEILYVGDQVADFKAASKAGLQFIAVTTGINNTDDFKREGCTNIISSLKSLEKILNLD